MSYEIVKSIKVDTKENKVFVTSACNNVYPRTYERWETPSFSKILVEQGKEEVEAQILKSFESGNFQGGSVKYMNALKVLIYVFNEEYAKYNWHLNHGEYGSEQYIKNHEDRNSKEFIELLKKCLKYSKSKARYVIFKDSHGTKIYGKRTKNYMKWSSDINYATKFNFEQEAKDNIWASFKDEWNVMEMVI